MKTTSHKIKELLITMAIDCTLPMDMNELDEHIFDPFILDVSRIERYAEQEALGHYLSEKPDTMTYDEVIEQLNSDDCTDEIVVWEPFENYFNGKVASYIEEYKNNVVSSLIRLLDV